MPTENSEVRPEQGKIDIVTNLAYFKNDREILEFLLYMEDK